MIVRAERVRRWLLGAALTGTLLGCGSTQATGDAGTTDTGAVADADSGARTVVGTFQVQLVAPAGTAAGYTSVVGRVQDGTTPEAILWTQTAASGDCRLLTPRAPFCNPACGTGRACVADQTCASYPTALDVGAVTVRGVRTSTGATGFDLMRVSGSYQVPGELSLPFPAFAEGDALRVEAAGSSSAPGFALEARGIAPFTLTSTGLRLETGQPVRLTWAAPTQTGQTIHVRLDISHHGGSRGKIECDTADDGELVLDAGLVGQLVALGVAGYPTIIVTRLATGTANPQGGRVELVVSSEVEAAVEIPGLRSCTSDSDCDGGTCREDLTCG